MNENLIVIFGDGDFPTRKAALDKLRKASGKNATLIACDHSTAALVKRGFIPDYIVGDMDSLGTSFKKRFAEKIHKDPDRATNDQTKAFHFAINLIKEGRPGIYNICFLGTTGKREDHTIGNVSLLADYAEEAASLEKEFSGTKINICSITNYGIFRPILGTTVIDGKVGDPMSIFAFDNTLRIKSKGLEYKTDNVKFDLWWKATLNKFSAARVELNFSHPAKALLFFPF